MSQMRPMIRQIGGIVEQLIQETDARFQEAAKEISKTNTSVDKLQDIVAALIQAVGGEKVQEELAKLLDARQKAEEAGTLAAIQELVAKGTFVETNEVVGDVMVLGSDMFEDGTTRQVRFELAKLQDQTPFVGKKVGDKISTEDGKTVFTVQGIYAINRQPVEGVPAPTVQ